MHNGTVAITVGAGIATILASPAAVYSVFMFITAGLFARLMYKRNAAEGGEGVMSERELPVEAPRPAPDPIGGGGVAVLERTAPPVVGRSADGTCGSDPGEGASRQHASGPR